MIDKYFYFFSTYPNCFNAINTSSINIGNKLAGIAIEKHLTDENLQQAQVQLENYAQDLQELVDERTVALKKSIVELRDSNLTLENEVNKRKEAQAKIKHALKREKELNELKEAILDGKIKNNYDLFNNNIDNLEKILELIFKIKINNI